MDYLLAAFAGAIIAAPVMRWLERRRVVSSQEALQEMRDAVERLGRIGRAV